MHSYRFLSAFYFVCCFSVQQSAISQQASIASASCQVYFSPRGGATSAVLLTIDDAKSTVLVQAYSFTSEPIADALVRAHRRGVSVQVLLDKSQRTQRYTSANMLLQAGIPVLFDASHAIAHNKVMIIDDHVVITGSFNFTKAAEERNAENLLIIRNKELAARYIDNWRAHQAHSTPFR